MLQVSASRLSKPANLAAFDAIIDTGFDYPLCKSSYSVTVIANGRQHNVLLTNCIDVTPPRTYLDGNRLIVLTLYSVFEVKLTIGYPTAITDINFEVYSAERIPAGILICHSVGCTLLSEDLQLTLWTVEDNFIVDVIWRDGELRAYYNKLLSVEIDIQSGKRIDPDNKVQKVVAATLPLPKVKFKASQDRTAGTLLDFPSHRITKR